MNVSVLAGGMTAWRKAGLPVSREVVVAVTKEEE
jgi:3-mercaptopyruvate sulfurtransferase SseA